MREFERVLRPGGKLYFSVPVGRERVEFNAHRVFAPRTVVSAFSKLALTSFSAVDDRGDFQYVVVGAQGVLVGATVAHAGAYE